MEYVGHDNAFRPFRRNSWKYGHARFIKRLARFPHMESGSMSLYPLNCDCGKRHEVSASQAGSDLKCDCGRTIDVPSLRDLRIAAGEDPRSAELAIMSMLNRGELPQEKECLKCGLPTGEVMNVSVECEKVESPEDTGFFSLVIRLFFIVFVAPIFAIIVTIYENRRFEGDETSWGRNVSFRLPLRMCSDCSRSPGISGIRELMMKIDLYRRLFEKYPSASISRV